MSGEQKRRLEGVAGDEMEAELRVLFRPDSDGPNHGAGVGGMGDGAAANDAAVGENQAVAFAADDEESRLNAPTLPPDVLFRILHQFMGDSNTAAAINKCCKQAVEEAAEEELRKIAENHHVGNVFMWRLDLATTLPRARIRRYYLQQDMPPTPGIEPTITPRLRLCCAKDTPLSSHEIPNLGPAAVLPDGNLVFYCVEDRLFRFYNVQGGTFYHQARAIGSSFPRVLRDSWIGKHLHCCNGFLVSQRDDNDGTMDFSVWRQSDLTFVRDIGLGPLLASVFDKERGTILQVFTDSRDGTTFLDVTSIDIESGEQSLVKSIRTQLTGNVMSNCELRMGLSGRNIIIVVYIDDEDQFPSAGLGVYNLCRDRPDEDANYFACFDQGLHLNLPFKKPSQWPCFIPLHYNNDSGPLRAIQLNGEDPPVVVDELVPLGERREVVRVTDTRLFVYDPDEQGEEIQIDEFDIETGRKVRTIRTGCPTEGHMLAYVESTETVLFLVISRNGSPVSFLQTFLL